MKKVKEVIGFDNGISVRKRYLAAFIAIILIAGVSVYALNNTYIGEEYEYLYVEMTVPIGHALDGIVPEVPEFEGYKFSHWSLSPNGAPFDFAQDIYDDATFYAIWIVYEPGTQHDMYEHAYIGVTPNYYFDGYDYLHNYAADEPIYGYVTWDNYTGTALFGEANFYNGVFLVDTVNVRFMFNPGNIWEAVRVYVDNYGYVSIYTEMPFSAEFDENYGNYARIRVPMELEFGTVIVSLPDDDGWMYEIRHEEEPDEADEPSDYYGQDDVDTYDNYYAYSGYYGHAPYYTHGGYYAHIGYYAHDGYYTHNDYYAHSGYYTHDDYYAHGSYHGRATYYAYGGYNGYAAHYTYGGYYSYAAHYTYDGYYSHNDYDSHHGYYGHNGYYPHIEYEALNEYETLNDYNAHNEYETLNNYNAHSEYEAHNNHYTHDINDTPYEFTENEELPLSQDEEEEETEPQIYTVITIYSFGYLGIVPLSPYTVTFNPNGGQPMGAGHETRTVASGGTIGLPVNMPMEPIWAVGAARIFVGWNTAQDYSGTMFTNTTPVK